MSFQLGQIAPGIWSGSFSSFPAGVAVHGLSGRLGGVSDAPYASLDLALHVGDVHLPSLRTVSVILRRWDWMPVGL